MLMRKERVKQAEVRKEQARQDSRDRITHTLNSSLFNTISLGQFQRIEEILNE